MSTHLDLLPAEELSDVLGELPELGEVDLAALHPVSAALVHEVHVFDEQREERNHDLCTEHGGDGFGRMYKNMKMCILLQVKIGSYASFVEPQMWLRRLEFSILNTSR